MIVQRKSGERGYALHGWLGQLFIRDVFDMG
jgi:hypothetical protein